MSAASTNPEARVRALGVTVLDTWDYDTARAGTIERLRQLRRDKPTMWRHARGIAFDMRCELSDNLPEVPPEVVEMVTITVLAKVLGLAIAQGAEPVPVLTAGSIAALAVLDEFWAPAGAL